MPNPPRLQNAPKRESRRSVLQKLAASVVAPVLPNVALANDNDLHTQVAARVRDLVGGQTLTLQMLAPEGSSGNLNPVIAQFVQMTGVNIALIETPVDDVAAELLLDAFAKLERYDLALPATFGLPDLVSAGAIQPITQFAAQHEPAGFRGDILFDVGDSFDGETYGFQTDGDAYMMFYHKGMLNDPEEQARYADRFGVALARPETWSELDRQMAYFNRPDAGQWGGLLFRTPSYLAWEWWVRFHAKGYWPFSKDMEPQIASDAGIGALEDMIRATEHLCPESRTLGLFENWERFSRGDVFCNIGWGGSQKYLNGPQSKIRGNMIFGPTPGGVVNEKLLITPYFNWGWNYVVTSNSRMPEISYLFALFASSPKMSTLAVRQADGFFDPYRPEHYADAGIQAAYSTEFLTVHRQSMEAAIPDLYLKSQGEYFRSLGTWLSRAVSGEIAPKEALNRVAARWNLITAAADTAVQQDRWARLRGKYPRQTQESLRDIA